MIPRKQRLNPLITESAREHYKKLLPELLFDTKITQNPAELEETYSKFTELLLARWDHTRKKLPYRFRSFWKSTLDNMTKDRRKLYRRALISGTDKHKEAHKELDGRIKRNVQKLKRSQKERMIEGHERNHQVACSKTRRDAYTVRRQSCTTPPHVQKQALTGRPQPL